MGMSTDAIRLILSLITCLATFGAAICFTRAYFLQKRLILEELARQEQRSRKAARRPATRSYSRGR